jgi:putative toxin-antitoxin system antitoxin component (TIGR02293 family)
MSNRAHGTAKAASGASSAKVSSQRLRQLATARVKSAAGTGLIDQVKQGLPFRDLDTLARDLGMTTDRLAEDFLGISRATLTRRRKSGQLNPDESDKVVRFSRLLQLATDLMEGDDAASRRWLDAPLPLLGNESPLEYARTEIGAHELEQLIGRLEHGVYS